MTRTHSFSVLMAAVAGLVGAGAPRLNAQTAAFAGVGPKSAPTATSARRYGDPVKLGDGTARSYLVLDEKTGAPREIGVALSQRALDGLPAVGSGHHGAGPMTHTFILDLPAGNKTPFTFVELNWNPAGHEPDGVYEGVPHFDFHFYTITKAEREGIVPTDPDFAKKADNVPPAEYVPPFNVPLGPPGAPPSKVAVPMMGVHWSDVRSPELQKLMGKPDAYKPFTATFIHGSWNGRFHFWEPMITRAHILEKKTTTDPAVRDQLLPLPLPGKYQVPGYYPAAYRITWDAPTKEYRIALTDLAWRK